MGYIMLTVSMIIIIYLSLSKASLLKETEADRHSMCFFNPLCSCSGSNFDLGVVTCRDVPFPRLPPPLNSSRAHTLHLENNGLRFIEPQFFALTGLYRIEISWNALSDLDVDAFYGLEWSLWQLDLHNNQLQNVPSRALRNLQKLNLLDLTGNEITNITWESWRGLEDSLETLILKDNGISLLPQGVFGPLQKLDYLDLGGNALSDIQDTTFRDGPPLLSHLYLADNMFVNIPFHQLSYLRFLRHLDLSLNYIRQIQVTSGEFDGKRVISMPLDTLRLDYNHLEYLPPGAFRNFPIANRTYLNGNPIAEIQDEAFRGSKIRELYLRDCGLSELHPAAFTGLESSLQVLDLTGNNLTFLPQRILHNFDLRTLSFKDNFLPDISREEAFDGFHKALHDLDLSGNQNGITSLQELRRMQSIRSLSLSRLPQPHLSPDDFHEFGVELQDLKISGGSIKSLKNHAFRNIRGLKRLDLAENSISTVENEAFAEIGHSLTHLNLAFGFSSSFSKLPNEPFRHLTSLEELDLSNNKLKTVPETSFYSMTNLKVLQLQDNIIETLPRGTFQGDIHTALEEIHYSFNHIVSVSQHTFTNLDMLERLWLDDNKIATLERRAFTNLEKLDYLTLRGNKINFISDEAFQNLPKLRLLDLAYNRLKDFDYGCLDQVGGRSSLSLNISYNAIRQLTSNVSTFGSLRVHTPPFSHIRVLDLSHNNITDIERWYFRPVESSITQLHLAHNSLINITVDVFGNMMHLQWLDLSWNSVEVVEFNAFRNCRKLQVLYLSNNRLSDISRDLFFGFTDLRVVELGNNRFRVLPDLLFNNVPIERLDLSSNLFSRLPFTSFTQDAAENLVELDVSKNVIVALPSPDAFARFKNIRYINLANNRLVRLEDGALSYLPKLSSLDLSDNLDIILDIKGRTFQGLENTLKDLFLRNLSLNALPEMHFASLTNLDLSDNGLYKLESELPQNFSALRSLELAGNQLKDVPLISNSFPQLRYLGLSRNPIQTIGFPQKNRLRELDIRHMPLNFFEVGALGKMPELQTLRLSPCRHVRDFNLPTLVQDNHALEHLHIESFDFEGSSLGEEMKGVFPAKLRNLTLTGRAFRTVTDSLFQGIRNPYLNFVLHNTSVEKISKSVFDQAKFARNVTVDVRSNYLKYLGNPSTGLMPNLPRKTFLLSLKLTDNRWTCDCELGWVEGWERKRRQYVCKEYSTECFNTDDDLRAATCDNKKRNSLLEVLKSDIECGWSPAGAVRSHLLLAPTLFAALLWATN